MEQKVVKQKKLDKELNLKISEDTYSARIYVEFSSDDRKLVLQRSFQNNIAGREQCAEFSRSLKTLQELRDRLGYTKTIKV